MRYYTARALIRSCLPADAYCLLNSARAASLAAAAPESSENSGNRYSATANVTALLAPFGNRNSRGTAEPEGAPSGTLIFI